MFSEQSIGYALVGIDRKSPIGYEWLANPQTLPLGPECDLSWAGFSDEGTLATMDSSGLLQVQLRSGMWMPLLDTRQNVKGKSDHYFLIGLSELEKCVRCVLCKGARYPPTLPRPNMSLLDVRLPLCDGANEKTQLEEALIQSTLQIQLTGTLDQTGFDVDDPRDKADRLSKESLMKMFAVSHPPMFVLLLFKPMLMIYSSTFFAAGLSGREGGPSGGSGRMDAQRAIAPAGRQVRNASQETPAGQPTDGDGRAASQGS
jgi:chromosome transmission fidelity protein 4